MRYIRFLFLAAILAVLVVVSMANFQMVTLTVLPGPLEAAAGWNFAMDLPLFLVVLGGVALGLLLGYVLEWIRESKHRTEVSRRQKQVKALNKEVSRLKVEKNSSKDEVLAILEDAEMKKVG